ncbi:type I polyketide synthase [Actinomadura barringtoniae]|uniref:Type I polyketide synthase n=1 Tax=Actinomadura barringtoniae TaxID=1427535 RepID=A0A939T2P8_9ACTN|nr:type I polyketide synthase [Actinomadura barringtoniae]MBO2445569.1 type I polyketide synthase [Actinomadura barringtoniae]
MDQLPEREPIAVVGIGCRFPGAGGGPEEFWQFLRDGKDAIRKVPAERWDVETFYDSVPATPGHTIQQFGGYLDDLDRFDAGFFGISQREAAKLDPQQRLLLEVTFEAIEDAGLRAERLEGSRTGVFVGVHWDDNQDLRVGDLPEFDVHTMLGGARSVLAGRVSYAFGLMGTSVAVDAACASSLVSINMAWQSLLMGESDVALAAGVNVILHPAFSVAFSQGKMLSPDGRSKAFSADADGFVRSEGAGVIVLKRLSQARADGDRVYAVIRGSYTNNDGRTSGAMSTPAEAGQEELLREAYRIAHVAPDQVHYVEAHGTGTAVGDPVEAAAIAAVFGEGRPADRPLAIGSVKTNIGHTEGASGIAGFIKAALALHHRELPPSLHSEHLNPAIPWDDVPIVVQRELEPWPQDRPLLAGVSSFGIGGTNAHIVLEGVEEPEPAAVPVPEKAGEGELRLLPISARSAEALRASAGALAEVLRPASGTGGLSLADVCRTSSVHRSHHEHRLGVVGATADAVATRLADFAAGGAAAGGLEGRTQRGGKTVFVFAGQGAQWQGMCAELMRTEPVFDAAIEECEQALLPLTGWPLRAVLAGEHGDITKAPIDMIQPTVFAAQVALAALWRSWGIVPDAVVGHSMGEVAAAHVAGALSLADAARVICGTSGRKREVSNRGGMLVVGLPEPAATEIAARYPGRLSIAAVNGPSTTNLAGDTDALQEVAAELAANGTFCQPVAIDVATHSFHMEPLRDGVLGDLKGITPAAPSVPFRSTVPGGVTGDGLGAQYWFRNMREPVLFWPAIQDLSDQGYDTFIEISAHPVLLSAIRHAESAPGKIRLLPSMRRGQEREALLNSLGTLYTAGRPIDWNAVHAQGRRVRLPAYPWQYSSFPTGAASVSNGGFGTSGTAASGGGGHPLLGQRLTSPVHVGTAIFETSLNARAIPLLADHPVQGIPVVPGAAYAEMALAAAADLDPGQRHEIADLSFSRALPLPDGRSVPVQVVLTLVGGEWRFQCFSDQRTEGAEKADWMPHAQGRVRRGATATDEPEGVTLWPVEGQEDGALVLDREEFYRGTTARGLEYGRRFQLLDRVRCGQGEAWAVMRDASGEDGVHDPYVISPAVLDACFQAMFGALEVDPDGQTRDTSTALFLPVELGTLTISSPAAVKYVYAHVTHADDSGFEGDIIARDADGKVVLEAAGLRMRKIAGPGDTAPETGRYRVSWEAVTAPPAQAGPEPRRYLLLDADDCGLQGALNGRGDTCVRVRPGELFEHTRDGLYTVPADSPGAFQRLLAEVTENGSRPLDGVIAAWALRAPNGTTGPDPADTLPTVCGGALHLVQALAATPGTAPPRLWLVSQGGQAISPEDHLRITDAALWGLGRTAANEHPELRCTLVDLEPGRPGVPALLAELAAGDDDEDEVAWRQGSRYASRLTDETRELLPPAPFRLETTRPGLLDELKLRSVARDEPGPGEVEIEVDVAGLNFKDVMRSMGLLPVTPPVRVGIECAGRITAVGAGVQGLSPGQRVVAVTDSSRGCVGSHVLADGRAVAPIPDDLAAEDAVTLPIVFLTAHYSLHTVGRMAAGETVLIHAGTGGVGMAAIQLARNAGATIYATAGSDEKRAYLRDELGIEHVMDSRSTDFAEEVLELTGGRGVDIILNSLSGDGIAAGLGALAIGGRFIELGKRDIEGNTHIALMPFAKAISFSAIDLEALLLEDPALVGENLRHVVDLAARGEITPLPHATFPVQEAGDAVRHLARARHMGKVLVSMESARQAGPPVRPDGTYLVTGGLGALGLSTARMLAGRGARHLLLIGRRAPSPEAMAEIGELRRIGVDVVTAQADVAQREELARALLSVGPELPPLRGVIHAAGALADRILEGLTWQDFAAVLAPKVSGALNLRDLTATADLDFFIMFSSVSALIGNPGQANYAAANAGMDALAHLMRAAGRSATSINWGPWSEIGMAADATRGDRMDAMGLRSVRPADGLAMLAAELVGDEPQVAIGSIDAQRWRRFHPRSAPASLLRGLLPEGGADLAPEHEDAAGPGNVLAAPPEERRTLLTELVSQGIASVTRSEAAAVRPDDRITSLGIDSLLAVELRHALETHTTVSVPTVLMLQGSTVDELINYVLERLPETGGETAGTNGGTALDAAPIPG